MRLEPCGSIFFDSHTGHLKNIPSNALGVSPTAWFRVKTLGDNWIHLPVGCRKASILDNRLIGRLRLKIPNLRYDTAQLRLKRKPSFGQPGDHRFGVEVKIQLFELHIIP